MQFYARLKNYYLDVAKVLRGEANAASIFPNSGDIGTSREGIYASFLRQHAPSKCNVFYGGFLFGNDGSESGQLDVLITTDTTPQFNFHVRDGQGKSFSPVEGTLGVASIKSTIDKKELENALLEISRIPITEPLGNRVNPMLKVPNYEDWPYKIIYASNGINGETLLAHINNFYIQNSEIPHFRRPNVIHVAGKYVIFRMQPGMGFKNGNKQVKINEFYLISTDPDLQAILWTLDALQKRATASTHIVFTYDNIINRVMS